MPKDKKGMHKMPSGKIMADKDMQKMKKVGRKKMKTADGYMKV